MCVTCVRVKDDTEEMRKTNQFMLEAKQHYIKALVGSRVVLEKVRSTKTKDFAGANLACQRAQANTNSGPIQIAKQQTPWQNGLAGVSDGRMMPAGLADQGHLQVTFGQQGNFMSIMTTVLLLFLCFYCLSLTLLLLLYYTDNCRSLLVSRATTLKQFTSTSMISRRQTRRTTATPATA